MSSPDGDSRVHSSSRIRLVDAVALAAVRLDPGAAARPAERARRAHRARRWSWAATTTSDTSRWSTCCGCTGPRSTACRRTARATAGRTTTYPQSFHAVLAASDRAGALCEHPTPSQELLWYTQATAVVARTDGRAAGARSGRPARDCAARRSSPCLRVGLILATMLVGPGATMLARRVPELLLRLRRWSGLTIVAAVLIIPRPISALHLAVLGGLLVAVANAWLPLTALAAAAALSDPVADAASAVARVRRRVDRHCGDSPGPADRSNLVATVSRRPPEPREVDAATAILSSARWQCPVATVSRRLPEQRQVDAATRILPSAR